MALLDDLMGSSEPVQTKQKGILTFDDYVRQNFGNAELLPKEYNKAIDDYSNKFADNYVQQTIGVRPKRGVTQYDQDASTVREEWNELVGSTLKKKKVDSALDTAGNLGRAFTSGAVGGVKGVVDIFGTDSASSEFLDGVQKGLQSGKTETSRIEAQRNQARRAAAENSGSFLNEITTYVKTASLEDAFGAGGSVATTLLAGGGIGLGARALGAAGAARGGMALFGAAQGVGGLKGDVAERVERDALNKGYSPEKAKEMATQASEYGNMPVSSQILAAGLGAAGGITGVERGLVNGLNKGIGRRIVQQGAEEGLQEGSQGAQSRIEQNRASIALGLTNDGLFTGAVGAFASDAALGVLMGAPSGIKANKAISITDIQNNDPTMQKLAPARKAQIGKLVIGGDINELANDTEATGDRAFARNIALKILDQQNVKPKNAGSDYAPENDKVVAPDITGIEGTFDDATKELLANSERHAELEPVAGEQVSPAIDAEQTAPVVSDNGQSDPESNVAEQVPERGTVLAKTNEPSQPVNDTAGTDNAVTATSGQVQGYGEIAKFVPSETGNKPQTEAINRAISEIEAEGYPITADTAKVWAEAHSDGYKAYIEATGATDSANREKFVSGTVDNILATAALNGKALGDTDKARADKRLDYLNTKEPNWKALTRGQAGDRQGRSEAQYRKDQGKIERAIEKATEVAKPEMTVSAPKPIGKEVFRFNGKFGKGMGSDAAKIEASRLRREGDKNISYEVEEHGDPKLANPYAVVGREKPKAVIQPVAQASAPQETQVAQLPTQVTPPDVRAEQVALAQAARRRRMQAHSNAIKPFYEKSPFLGWLMESGIKKSLKSEWVDFNPHAVTTGPLFRKNGMALDALHEKAIQDGYLPKSSDESDLYNLITRQASGDRIVPLFGIDGDAHLEEMQAKWLSRMEDDASPDAPIAGLTEAGNAIVAFVEQQNEAHVDLWLESLMLPIEADANFVEQSDNTIIDLPAETPQNTARAMRELGFTEQEIQNEIRPTIDTTAAPAIRQSNSRPDEATARGAPQGAGRDRAAPESSQGNGEGLTATTLDSTPQRKEVTHNDLRIYPIRIKVGEKVKDMWAVQSLNNAEREQKGERQLGGDPLSDTIDGAKKLAEEELAGAKTLNEYRNRMAELDSDRKKAKDAEQAKKNANKGKSIADRRTDSFLDSPTKFSLSAGLGSGTKRESMQAAVEQGRLVHVVMVRDEAAKNRDIKSAEQARRQNLPVGNINYPGVKEHVETVARLRADDYKKPSYRVHMEANASSAFYEVTKTEYDYAKSLVAPLELTSRTAAEERQAIDAKEAAPKAEEKAQIDREAALQTLTSPTAPDQRRDTTGGMFDRELADAQLAQSNQGVAREVDPNQTPMFARIDGESSSQPTGALNANPADQQTIKRLGELIAKSQGLPEQDGSAAYISVSLPQQRDLGAVAQVFGKRLQAFRLSPVLRGTDSVFGKVGGVVIPVFKNTLFINESADRPHLSVLGHELVHEMKRDVPGLYSELVSAIRDYVNQPVYRKNFGKEAVAKYLTDDNAIREEFVAEIVSDGFLSNDFWNAIYQKSPTLLEKITGALGALIDKVRRTFGKQKRMEKYLTDYDKAMQIAGDVMAKYAKTRQGITVDDGGIQFSQNTAVTEPTTPAAIQSAIEKIFGGIKDVWPKLSKSTVVINTDGITEEMIPLSDKSRENAQAFYQPSTGKIYMIADRIRKGTEQGTWLHEAFHKRGEELLGKANMEALHSTVQSWAKRPVSSVERQVYEAANKRAKNAAPEGSTQATIQETYDLELVTYAIEESINRGVTPDLKATDGTLSNWLAKVFDAFNRALNKLLNGARTKRSEIDFSAQDLVAMAYGAAKLELENSENAGMSKNSQETLDQIDDALNNLTGNDLEDDQVFSKEFPDVNDESITYLTKIGDSSTGMGGYHVYVRGDEIRGAGAHEFFFYNNNDEFIGFSRLTKNEKQASINMIAFIEDERGYGFGKAFYKYLLDEVGVSIKTDKEITDSTNSLYQSLVKQYAASVDNDGRVVIKPNSKGDAIATSNQPVNTKRDAEYMAAAKRGDTATTQRMVDEAARAAGYVDAAYHGTSAEPFTVFNTQGGEFATAGTGAFFSSNKDNAKTYGKTNRYFLNLGGDAASINFEGRNWNQSPMEYIAYDFDGLEIGQYETKAEAEKAAGEDGNVIDYPLRMGEGNQVEVDFESEDGRPNTTNGLAQQARELGYTSFTAKNVKDTRGGYDKPQDTIVIFNPEQIKLADPITYDNAGNIIPLSERFNAASENVRYSKVPSLAQIEEIAKTGKVPTEKSTWEERGDDLVTKLTDDTRPFDVWTRDLPDQGAAATMVSAKNRASGMESAFNKGVMDTFGTELAKVMAKIVKATKANKNPLDTEAAQRLAGDWMSATYAPIANQNLLAKDTQALKEAVAAADIEQTPATKGAVTRAKNDLLKRQAAIVQNKVIDPDKQPHDIGLAGGYNNATAKHVIELAEKKAGIPRALLKEAAEVIYRLNAWKLQKDIELGKIDRELAATFDQSGKYVPLTGDPRADESSADVFGTGSVNQGKDRSMKGRRSSLSKNGIEASFEQVQKTARYHGWNDFKVALHTMYENAVAIHLANGDTYQMANRKAYDDTGVSRQPETMQRPSDNVIIYRKANESWVYDLHNEDATKALKNANAEPIPAMLRYVSMGTRFMSRMVTQFMPGFAPVNAMRDTWEKSENIRTRVAPNYPDMDMNAVARAMLGQSIKSLTSLHKSITPVVAQGTPLEAKFKLDPSNADQKMMMEFLADGGASTWGDFLAHDGKDLSDKLKSQLSLTTKAMKTLDVWNNSWELISSFSAYKALRENGMASKDAANMALELMNFRKGGEVMRPIKALYMFAQPIATGGHQLLKTLDTKRGKARFAAYLIAGTALYAMLRSGEDDEELGVNKMDETSNFILERNILIPMGDDYLKIPIGFGLPMLAWTYATNVTKMTLGKQTAAETAAELLVKTPIKTFAPVAPSETSFSKQPAVFLAQSVTPSILKPVVNVAIDRNFAGGALTNNRFAKPDKANALEGRKNTPEFYTDIAKELNVVGIDAYPEQVKEIMRGYLVGLPNELLKAAVDNPAKEARGKETSSIFIDRWVMQQDDDALRQRLYYRHREELNEVGAKASLGRDLSAKESAMLKLLEEAKKEEGAARGIKGAATRQFNKTKNQSAYDAATQRSSEAMDKVQVKIIRRMNVIGAID